jgi:ABC-type Fe3+-siderophore transport system permease subunit
MDVNAVLQWILARVEEPSTWAGAGVAAVLIHSIFPGALGDSILQVGAAIGALLAIVIPEASKAKEKEKVKEEKK